MRNIFLATAAAVALVSAVFTPQDAVAQPQNVTVNNEIVLSCAVTQVPAPLTLNGTGVGSTAVGTVTLNCNDIDGATVTVTSQNGGLDHSDSELPAATAIITYDADLTHVDTTLVVDLNLAEVPNTSASGTAIDGTLSTGIVADLLLTLTEAMTYAGDYTDQLQIDITAN